MTDTTFADDDVRCSYHPDTLTRLRCSRCGKPICPRCGVRTPVGLRCPECAGVRGLPTYRTGTGSLAKAAGLGLLIAVVTGVIWSRIPDWGFYLALVLGFGLAEAMAWAVRDKRGTDLQLIGIGLVVLTLLISRYLLFDRYGLSLGDFGDLTDQGRRVLHVRIVPDLLIALLPVLIVWRRFR
ncbi:MAG: hypothetical protein IT334_04075 [Thermomicrobiales bacterium]|nr:hypothetical protein [Thermomicrobiales bacterium]